MTIKLHKYERELENLNMMSEYYNDELKNEWDNYYDDQVDYIRGVCERNVVEEDENFCNFYLTFVSFGFKYGIPSDADLVFDVRFLPNPFYVDALKPLTGNDREVYDYVMSSDKAVEFRKKMKDMLDFLIPNYIAEGKTQLVIAIGCTGGKHRSVTLTNALYQDYENTEYGCKKEHRDIEKDRLRSICRSQEK